MMTALHPLVSDYLARLGQEARRLPDDQARELLDDIREHLTAALGDEPAETDVRSTLDRLGSPAELVDEAGGVRGVQTPAGPPQVGGIEITALVTLIAAELIFIIWFVAIPLWVVGLVLLAVAPAWTGREKLLGFATLATGLPLLLVSVVWIAFGGVSSSTVCEGTAAGEICTTSDPGSAWGGYLFVALAVGYLVLQIWTVWRLTRRRTPAA